jgi:C4-dicarboxylate-specific signal transduction histidine kinase
MSTAQVTVLVIIIVAVLLLVGVAIMLNRRRSLRQRFGPEYDRAVESADDRRAAERELRDRERRHAELELRDLDPAARERYSASWEEIQVRFVDAPEQAVGEADELVTRLIAERGYPTGDYDDQLAHLSVEHARTLDHYRSAHDIHERNSRGEATTEQLRQALVHYRALFADLLGTGPDRLAGSTHSSDATPDRERQS